MLTRNDIINTAIIECISEMYAKAQPPLDYKQLINDAKNGLVKDNYDDPIYQRHYLSQEEFDYIKDKYASAYRLTNEWKNNSEFILEILKEGGGYENGKCNPLKNYVGRKHADVYIKHFTEMIKSYRFDNESARFSWNVCLGSAPTSNYQKVIDYWADKNIYIDIEFRDPETFWYRDEFEDDWEKIYKEDCENEMKAYTEDCETEMED